MLHLSRDSLLTSVSAGDQDSDISPAMWQEESVRLEKAKTKEGLPSAVAAYKKHPLLRACLSELTVWCCCLSDVILSCVCMFLTMEVSL